MTRIDFYITGDGGERARELVACRLAAKAFSLDHWVHVHAASADQAQQLDALMWTFRDSSFVPHAVAGDALLEDPATGRSVVIGSGHEPAERCNLVINLGDEVPRFFSRVERVAEIIDGDSARREAGRERFRFYRDRGYQVETHKL